MEKTKEKATAIVSKSLLTFLAMLLAGCGIASYILWCLIRPLSLSEIRIWAILSTLALPVAAGIGFWFGRREARMLSDGMRMGVNEVSQAADKVTEFKGKMADRMRQPPVTVQVAAGTLPSPPVHHRQLESGRETVDL